MADGQQITSKELSRYPSSAQTQPEDGLRKRKPAEKARYPASELRCTDTLVVHLSVTTTEDYPLRRPKTLITAATIGRRMTKWQALLKGKSIDEQLWAVTPPHGGTSQGANSVSPRLTGERVLL